MKTLLVTICIFTVIGMGIGVMVKAAEESVTATVMVQQVSLSITDGTVAYGTLATSGTKGTHSGDLDDSQSAQNTGNVNVDFDIKGTNVSGGCTWTLAATQDSEEYFHQFCTGTCTSPPDSYTALTTNFATLDTGVAPTSSTTFDLYLGVPSSTTCSEQVNVNVTVQASASS